MGGYQVKPELLEAVKKEVTATNLQLLKSLQGKEDIFNTTAYIKILFSDTLLEDVDFLNTLSGQPIFKVRYAQMILRDMLEQVIEFIFLMKHPDMIPQYLGDNINSNAPFGSNPVNELQKMASGRYADGRKTVSEMAKDINEKKSSPGRPALYEIYRLLSEECHNSYFFARLDDFKEARDHSEILALSEDQAQHLVIIVMRFMEAYRA